MKPVVIILMIYLIIINIIGFILMSSDKSKAKEGSWRIPEKVFFIVSIVGGSLGTWAGMYVFHHKTKHWYFVVFIPVILALQVIAAVLYLSGVF